MLRVLNRIALTLFVACLASTVQASGDDYAEGGAKKCLSCHDFGSESPVHAMLDGAHGQSDNDDTPMGQRGCEDCHGPSARHVKAPTQVSPGVSYGPRWSSSIADQDQSCLTCHGDNVAKHWRDALHMVNDLTCVTCHDVHQDQDKVLHPESQGEVCTVCHKEQKSGIHGLSEHQGDNPACTNCHNPHDAESAQHAMLDNRSEGCSSCHDLVAMAGKAGVTDKANSYHKVMTQQDRTCLDCHQGVAHSSAAGVKPVLDQPSQERMVSLFFPGQSDSQWLLTEHPGSQPLRQGRNCQQCHRGEEDAMARKLSGDAGSNMRELAVSFAKDASTLKLTLSWSGPMHDNDISIMWGDHNSEAFRRGGCFAACHNDMEGMSRDRGGKVDKYLMASRAQQQRIGQPAIARSDAELEQMIAQGQFVELWRVKLGGANAPKVETATLLAGLDWHEDSLLTGTSSYENGRWTVSLERPLKGGTGYKDFVAEQKYTLGIALHGDENPGARHWISLPLTMSFDGDDTDFIVE
jgi:DmsE family decaheme c-type cytochrome